jgi:hypothetical protein
MQTVFSGSTMPFTKKKKTKTLIHIHPDLKHLENPQSKIAKGYEINQQDATIQVNLFIPSQLYMFRTMFSPIIRST